MLKNRCGNFYYVVRFNHHCYGIFFYLRVWIDGERQILFLHMDLPVSFARLFSVVGFLGANNCGSLDAILFSNNRAFAVLLG